MSAFDDREHLWRSLGASEIPTNWEAWLSEQFHFD
jgi:hypothetical protein